MTLAVRSFDENGVSHGSLARSARSGELLRMNWSLPTMEGAHHGSERRLEVSVTGCAHVLAYRVNATGDPVTLQPVIEGSDRPEGTLLPGRGVVAAVRRIFSFPGVDKKRLFAYILNQ